MKQACFNIAIQLGNSPTMIFGGELHKYVQFITMFRNSFDESINDPVALYEILMRHVKGPAKKAIELCNFSASSVNRYEEAMLILKKRYGQKNGAIRSYRQELMNGKITADTIPDFEVLANELKCFHSVLVHYDVNLEYFSREVVRDIIARRLSKRMCSEFTNFIRIRGHG